MFLHQQFFAPFAMPQLFAFPHKGHFDESIFSISAGTLFLRHRQKFVELQMQLLGRRAQKWVGS
jgi:hypothetical protein